MEKEAGGDQIEVPDFPPPLALLDDEHRHIVSEFRQSFHEDESLTKEDKAFVDDYTAYRYLKARTWKVPLADAMLRETLKWRAEFKPQEITVEEMESQIRAGHMYQHGYDRYQRPVVYLKVHTEEDPHTRLQKLQFMIHCLEEASRVMNKEHGVEKMVWVCSCKGYNMKYNGEVGFARELLNILQSHYPERLGALVCLDAPFIFRGMWRIVSPFVDTNTLKKVVFVQTDGQAAERREALESIIDLEYLPKEFGGEDDWEFDADEYIARLKKAEEEQKAKRAELNQEGKKKRNRKRKKNKKKKQQEESKDDDDDEPSESAE